MTKEEILKYFKDINGAYNECTRYDDLKRMLEELEETAEEYGYTQGWLRGVNEGRGVFE